MAYISEATVDPALERATQAAATAARESGVVIRELDNVAALNDVIDLFSIIWGRSGNPPMTIELLRAFTKAGNYVAGAFDGETLVGACVGFFHAPSGSALHSHIAGVSAAAAGRKVGFALKLHQRSWALRRGVVEIAWTFDPLVSRNAYFNLTKLAARPVEYLPDFYGPMGDAINGGGASDRLLVSWRLRDERVDRAVAGRPNEILADDEIARGAVVALGVGPDGRPVAGRLDGETSLVAVPRDVEKLRGTDPAIAGVWRVAVRDALSGLTERGGKIDGFTRDGQYVVRP
ncbi:GNAT family N-acetyltransferase [Amycolatopsis thailandensis]|uniref:GNAT family N-acetyltransferase n=1 Tax=Amycolatopsis thailandensis TaxID=589330 RepID=UPI00363F5D7F